MIHTQLFYNDIFRAGNRNNSKDEEYLLCPAFQADSMYSLVSSGQRPEVMKVKHLWC